MFRKRIKKYLVILLPLVVLLFAVFFFVYRTKQNNSLRGELVCAAYASSGAVSSTEGKRHGSAEAGESTGDASSAERAAEIVSVYLCGAVQRPDVYEVPKGTRLHEVLKLAGGFREDAAEDAVNLASLAEDGSMIRVPTKEEATQGAGCIELSLEAESGKVDLNRADKEELMKLPGVGERKAEQILAYRKAHGRFRSIEEIKNIPGIKDKAFEKLKDSITVRE